MPSGHRVLARAIHGRAKAERRKAQGQHQLGVVKRVGTGKWQVDLMGADMTLADDDLHLSQWVRTLHHTQPIKKGDNFVIHRINGHWVVVDVITDSDIPDFAS